MIPQAFFTFQASLPRQGPGDAASLRAALGPVDPSGVRQILDAGCGVGADVETLLDWAPAAHVTAVDTHAPFIEALKTRLGPEPRLTALATDMGALEGPFDLIWCAGALYFLGLEAGLARFREILTPGGILAFSYPAYFTPEPSAEAQAFWEGEPVSVRHDTTEAVRAAGFEVLYEAPLPDAAWHAYYDPMRARVSVLRPDADAEMAGVLDAAEAEADGWEAARTETGYLQITARRI